MIFVTGAAGFIGQNVIERLTEDHDVRGMVFSDEEKAAVEQHGAEAVVGDITDPEDVEAAIDDDIDVIINLVGILNGTPDQFEAVHVGGTRNLLEASEDLDQFIYISALGATYESTPYFRTKHEAESVIKEYDIPYTIFRPSIVFGADDGFINLLIDQVTSYPVVPVLGSGDYRLQPIYVEDLAELIAHAIGNDDCLDDTFQVGGPGIMTLDQIVDLIMDKTDTDKRKVHTPLSLASLGAPIARAVMDVPLSQNTIQMLKQENYVKEHHYTDIFDVNLHSLEDMFTSIYLTDEDE
ncbi:MAG: NAD-dependent epimerase/dehydratase family protein [Candidatus Nanohaloarchaeota archaeon QJJ-5]|nr:NAD-dependent epimerase/dehydratase family protein [Candidatus Nanohaloarchaeota archaeon QJJ-5]